MHSLWIHLDRNTLIFFNHFWIVKEHFRFTIYKNMSNYTGQYFSIFFVTKGMTDHFDRIFPVDNESGTQNVPSHFFRKT